MTEMSASSLPTAWRPARFFGNLSMEHIFDTHAHYDDAAFDADREELLAALPQKGVELAVDCATDLVTSAHIVEMVHKYDYIYAALGYHPEQAGDERKGDLDTIAGFLQNEPKAVAVGEIGLDYHYKDGTPRETQIDLFSRQLALAKDLHLPVVIHDRDAHQDTLELLKKYRPQGVVHCFSGSVEMMEEVVKLGMYIGLGGAVTFKNAKKPVAVAAAVPLDRLLLETDCPYMAPTPHRGERNDSSLIAFVAEKIGEVRGMDPQEVVNAANANGRRMYGIEQEGTA